MLHRLIADAMLGRLARWLRDLAGGAVFDAALHAWFEGISSPAP